MKLLLFTLLLISYFSCENYKVITSSPETPADSIKVIIGNFLGSPQRNYYGNIAPEKLTQQWRTVIDTGITILQKNNDTLKWCGTGWTGQSLLIQQKDSLSVNQ